MKMKKWLKCLLVTTAFTTAADVGTTAATIPAAAQAGTGTAREAGRMLLANEIDARV